MRCRECALEIPNGTKVCPRCKTRLIGIGTRSVIAVVSSVVVGICLVYAVFALLSERGADRPGPSVTEAFSVRNVTDASGEYGNRFITGEIVNNSAKRYSYVQVQINLYDGAGAQLGSTMANVNNLEPGGVWKFRAVVLQDDFTAYKVAGVSGF